MKQQFQGVDVNDGGGHDDPIADFFARGVQDRFLGWDLFANVAHWASVSAGIALMAAAGLGFF